MISGEHHLWNAYAATGPARAPAASFADSVRLMAARMGLVLTDAAKAMERVGESLHRSFGHLQPLGDRDFHIARSDPSANALALLRLYHPDHAESPVSPIGPAYQRIRRPDSTVEVRVHPNPPEDPHAP